MKENLLDQLEKRKTFYLHSQKKKIKYLSQKKKKSQIETAFGALND